MTEVEGLLSSTVNLLKSTQATLEVTTKKLADAEAVNKDQQRLLLEADGQLEKTASKSDLVEVERVMQLLSSHRDQNLQQHGQV